MFVTSEIMPGVRMFDTPGHSVGHMTVEVDSACGKYLCVGDAVFILDNLRPIPEIQYDITPPNRFSNIVETWKSIELIKERAEGEDRILTCHDRSMLERIAETPVLGRKPA